MFYTLYVDWTGSFVGNRDRCYRCLPKVVSFSLFHSDAVSLGKRASDLADVGAMIMAGSKALVDRKGSYGLVVVRASRRLV